MKDFEFNIEPEDFIPWDEHIPSLEIEIILLADKIQDLIEEDTAGGYREAEKLKKEMEYYTLRIQELKKEKQDGI